MFGLVVQQQLLEVAKNWEETRDRLAAVEAKLKTMTEKVERTFRQEDFFHKLRQQEVKKQRAS